MRSLLILVLGLCLPMTSVFGQGAAPAEKKFKKSDVVNVLDFEADVIEGNKKSPELFLQTEVLKTESESYLFIREDFDQEHLSQKNRRPRLGGGR